MYILHIYLDIIYYVFLEKNPLHPRWPPSILHIHLKLLPLVIQLTFVPVVNIKHSIKFFLLAQRMEEDILGTRLTHNACSSQSGTSMTLGLMMVGLPFFGIIDVL